MDDDSDQSSEATQFQIVTRERKMHGYTDNVSDSGTVNEDEFDDDATVDQREVSDLETNPMEIEEYSRSFQSETLLSGLADVPMQYEVQDYELERLKNHLQGSHQEALAIVIAQATQTHAGNQIQLAGVPSSTSELSPTITDTKLNSREMLSTGDQKVNSDPKTISTSRTVKTPIDVYNWRKYGQKQVKSIKGSRSYFKCTYNECEAKKIESCDQYSSITKVVYKGQHKHDTPKKVYTRREKVLAAISREQKRKMISRNYYKCMSSGCPVRKHIEMAVDGSSEVVLTYNGIHDHDTHVPTKDQSPPTVLTAVSLPSKNNSQSNKGEAEPANIIKIKIKP